MCDFFKNCLGQSDALGSAKTPIAAAWDEVKNRREEWKKAPASCTAPGSGTECGQVIRLYLVQGEVLVRLLRVSIFYCFFRNQHTFLC